MYEVFGIVLLGIQIRLSIDPSHPPFPPVSGGKEGEQKGFRTLIQR